MKKMIQKISLKHLALLWLLGCFCQSALWAQSKGVTPLVIKTASGETVGAYQRSYALLIGMSRYDHWDHLESIPKELDAVESALKQQGFVVQREANLDAEQLSAVFEDFINDHGFDPHNRLLFYFSGHGHSIGADRGFLVPTDAPSPEQEAEFRRAALSMGQILTWSRDMIANHALFLFDSCFSGTIFKTKSYPTHPPVIDSYTARPVRQFITAGSAGETVPAKSVFSPYFVRGLRGQADLDGDGYVIGTELGMYLRSKVVNSEIRQTPQYGKIQDTELNEGDFVFQLQKPSTTTSTTTLPPRPKPVVFQGHIQVNVDTPGASVYLNGDYQGTASPQKTLELLHIPIGEASVEVQKKGYYSATQKVSVRANDWIQPVFHLTPLTTTTQVTIRPKPTLPPTTLPARIDSPTEPQDVWTEPHTGIRMVSIPGGSFEMGDLFDDGYSNEQPIHAVRLDTFWLGETEVTQGHWSAIMGENDREPHFKGDDLPMEKVSWEDAQRFIKTLNAKHQGRYQFRLPSEAEWEYACREGGKKLRFGNGQDTVDPSQMNFDARAKYKRSYSVVGQYRGKTVPAKSFFPNAFGLYQMSGNIWEWVEDEYTSDYSYMGTEYPKYTDSGDGRVIRGGSWSSFPQLVRCANRNDFFPGYRRNSLGFRLARTR